MPSSANYPSRFQAQRVISYDMLERIGSVREYGKGRWMIDLRTYGGGRLYSDRGEPLKTQAEAQRLLTQIHGKLRKGRTLESVIDEFFPDRGKRHLLHKYARVWLETKESQVETGERSISYTRTLRSYIEPGGYFDFWEGISIYEITTKKIREWTTYLIAERKIKARTAHKAVATLNAIMNWLREDEELEFTPPRVPYPRFDRAPPRVISSESQDAVLGEIPEERRGPFLAMALLGVRPNEAIALDVTDFDEAVLYVNRAKKGRRKLDPIRGTKSGEGKVLPVPPTLADWIGKWVRPHRIQGPLFTNPRGRSADKRWSLDALEDTWNKAAASVGIQINLYNGTKHSCATEILQRAPKHVVQALLGHADIRSVDNYGRVNTTTLAGVIRDPKIVPLSQMPQSKDSDQ